MFACHSQAHAQRTYLADEAAVGQLVQQAQQQRGVGFVAERRQQRPPMQVDAAKVQAVITSIPFGSCRSIRHCCAAIESQRRRTAYNDDSPVVNGRACGRFARQCLCHTHFKTATALVSAATRHT